MKAPAPHVAFRLDPAILGRVDALIPLYSTPWRKAKRSDALRALVLAGLATEESKAAKSTVGGPASPLTETRRCPHT